MHCDNDNEDENYLPEDDAGEHLKRSAIIGQAVKVGSWTTRRTKADTQVFGAGLSLGDPPPGYKPPPPAANDNESEDRDEAEAPKKKGAVENPLRKVLKTAGTPEQMAAADRYEALWVGAHMAIHSSLHAHGTEDCDELRAMRRDQHVHVVDKDDAPLVEEYKGARGLRQKWFDKYGIAPMVFKGHHAPKPPSKSDDCWDTLVVAAIDARKELAAANRALGKYQPAIEAVCCHGATMGDVGGVLGYLSKDGSPSKYGEGKGKKHVLAGLDILVALFSKDFSEAA